MRALLSLVAVVTGPCLWAAEPRVPPRQMEHLGRGVVAIHQGEGKVFVSWRLLGTDPDGIAFNVYRTSGGRARSSSTRSRSPKARTFTTPPPI